MTKKTLLFNSEKDLYIIKIIVYIQMKKTINKVLRWLRTHEPEQLVNWLWLTEPSAYASDMDLINRKDFYINYGKRC